MTPAVRFDRQQDVGTAHVAIQSIAPFEDYIGALQPTFEKSTDQALSDVLAQTSASDAQAFRALLASVKLALPTSSVAKTSTTTTKNDQTTTESTRTQQSGPGQISDVPAAPAAATNALGALTVPDTHLGVDESLRLKAATALLQEVTLLNNYVRDAAVRTHRTPYIVRLLITLLPNARNEPYDVFTTVSFFTRDMGGANALLPERFTTGSPPTRQQIEQLPKISPEARAGMLQDRKRFEEEKLLIDKVIRERGQSKCDNQPLEILPLLVTDNLESSLRSQSAEDLRDLAASLQLMIQSVGAAAGVQRQSDALQKALNRDMNSIFTVARLNDNTIQARLGATYASDSYAIVPRTYNLTLLLLVPSEELPAPVFDDIIPCSYATFIGTTYMRDAERGTQLPSLRKPEELQAFEQSLAEWHLDTATNTALATDLLHYAEFGDFAAFADRIRRSSPTVESIAPDALWLNAVALAAQSGRSVGTLQVPKHDHHMFPMPDGDEIRVPTLLDTAKDVATITLTGGKNLLRDRLDAALSATVNDKDITLTPTDIKVGPDGRNATFTFPSVLALASDDQHAPASARLVVQYLPGVRNWQSREDYGSWKADDVPIIRTAPPDPPRPEFTVRAPAAAIRSTPDGVGDLTIEFATKKPKKMYFRIAGAEIVSTSDNVKVDGADHYLNTSGTAVLHLRNLSTRSDLIISSWRIGGEKENGGDSIFADDVRVSIEEGPSSK